MVWADAEWIEGALNRRDFLKRAGAIAVATVLPPVPVGGDPWRGVQLLFHCNDSMVLDGIGDYLPFPSYPEPRESPFTAEFWIRTPRSGCWEFTSIFTDAEGKRTAYRNGVRVA